MRATSTSALVGAAGTILVLGLYLMAVVLSTPIFNPSVAVTLAIRQNWLIIAVLSIGLGVQLALLTYRRALPCPSKTQSSTVSTTVSGSALSAFASLIGLANIGCCSLFIFYLSTLVGLGAATFLLQYSEPMTILGMAVMALSIGLNVRHVRAIQRQLAS